MSHNINTGDKSPGKAATSKDTPFTKEEGLCIGPRHVIGLLLEHCVEKEMRSLQSIEVRNSRMGDDEPLIEAVRFECPCKVADDGIPFVVFVVQKWDHSKCFSLSASVSSPVDIPAIG